MLISHVENHYATDLVKIKDYADKVVMVDKFTQTNNNFHESIYIFYLTKVRRDTMKIQLENICERLQKH